MNGPSAEPRVTDPKPAAAAASAASAASVPAVSVIIPCFNERDAIPQCARLLPPVLDELDARHGQSELVFVDDGSTDGTPALLTAAFAGDPRVRVVCHARNQGLGAAIRTGLFASRGARIVTTDADGTYDFADIPALLERLGPGVDVVTASPYHPEGAVEGVPAYRLILSRGASTVYGLILGDAGAGAGPDADGALHTYTAMFRAYRRPVLEAARGQAPGYLAMAEILAEAILAGAVVAEFPTVLRVRRYGQSKARVLRILRDHLRFQAGLLPRAVLHRLRRTPKDARP